jgi:hypothetical protein
MEERYAALDVSDKTTHVCVVDKEGTIIWRGVCATDPEALATVLKKRCPAVIRVVLETGPLSSFLYHGLIERGLPAICVLLARVKRPCALQTWGKKLAETKGPKRARVAVARKLAVLLHRLWLSQGEFRWT